jgi:cellulose synthase/poly-beta-1,6-N-acetylglucosamine synthase-like glycosyltransferase
VNKGTFEPNVSILIPAYNEEASIERTILNKLEIDYPKDKFEIIVISDGSTDKTDQIAKSFESNGVKLIRQEPRNGKTSAINIAVPKVKGEILVFSDANSMYAQDAIKKLVQNFSDPDVGYVTGRMIYSNTDGSFIGDGCTVYMKYENFLRRIETKLGSVVGVDGGIDAVRKKLYVNMAIDQLPDFVLPLKVVEQGYRVVYESEAILKEPSLKVRKDEYRMRVRVALRAFWALSDMRQMLSFKKFKLFTLQLWSHKVLRYLSFIFLIGLYISNLTLWAQNGYYKILFILQNLFYLSAFISLFFEKKGYSYRLISLINYFLLLNLASCHAFLKFIFRLKQFIWIPRKG